MAHRLLCRHTFARCELCLAPHCALPKYMKKNKSTYIAALCLALSLASAPAAAAPEACCRLLVVCPHCIRYVCIAVALQALC
jgi:hypothetical protein